MKKTTLIRKNIYMADELAEWYVMESGRTGNSQSSLMANALQFYVDYKKSLDVGANLERVISLLQEKKEILESDKKVIKELMEKK